MASIIKSDNGVSSGITGIVQSADSSGQLSLQTTTSGGTATTAVTIDNTQKVTFANSIGFGSNAGITFNNSSALTNSTLNDYEVGTWTPVVNGTTLSTGIGKYTKIGSRVFLSFNNVTGIAALSNGVAASITGIPFAMAGSGGTVYDYGGAACLTYAKASNSYIEYPLVARMANATNNIADIANQSGSATTTGDAWNFFASYQASA